MAPASVHSLDRESSTPDNGPGNEAYGVDKDIILESYQRKVKALTIGAGISGIMIAYKIQKECQNVKHVIYEKNPDIGGTWFENRYPN